MILAVRLVSSDLAPERLDQFRVSAAPLKEGRYLISPAREQRHSVDDRRKHIGREMEDKIVVSLYEPFCLLCRTQSGFIHLAERGHWLRCSRTVDQCQCPAQHSLEVGRGDGASRK